MEAAGDAAVDAFRVEYHDHNLLRGVNEEPLARAVSGLLDAVSALVLDGEAGGQLAFESSQQEICLQRLPGFGIEMSVIELSQRPLRLNPPTHLELESLLEATLDCARGFVRDSEKLSGTGHPEVLGIEKRLRVLERAVLTEHLPLLNGAWGVVRTAQPGLGFFIADVDGRALRWSRRASAALPALLLEGGLMLPSGAVLRGLPLLQLMGLARAAADGPVLVDGQHVKPQAIFEAGLALVLALRSQNAALGSNPYVQALQVRCTDALAARRPPLEATGEIRPRPSAPRREGRPVSSGSVRKVSYATTWEQPVALGEEGGRLQLGGRSVIVASKHGAHVFNQRGGTLLRVTSRGSVTCFGAEHLVLVEERRLWCLDAQTGRTRWLRAPDAPMLGSEGQLIDGVLLTTIDGRGAIGLDAHTGRERWRVMPERAQRCHLMSISGRVIISTDTGAVVGIDPAAGQPRFRVKASMPCIGAPVKAGLKLLALLNRGDHTTLFELDAFGTKRGGAPGGIGYSRELPLRSPVSPVWARSRAFVAGLRDGAPTVYALGSKGHVLWDRRVPLKASRLTLWPFEGGVIVADPSGGAARLLPDGELDWVHGGADVELARALPMAGAKRLLVVPGPKVALLEPASGRVVTDIALGAELADIHIDKTLAITAYVEPGRLLRLSPTGHLAVL